MFSPEDNNRRSRRSSLVFPPLSLPNWDAWAKISNAELWKIVALSCNVDPDCFATYLERGPIRNKDLLVFHNRLDMAIATLIVNHGELFSIAEGPSHKTARVELGNFRAWATGQGWEVPKEFPNFPATRVVKETPAVRAKRLYNAICEEISGGLSTKAAIEKVASGEPNQTKPGEFIKPATLRKIYDKYIKKLKNER